MKPAKKGTQKSPKSATGTGKDPTGFTDEERVAMRERIQELKADARREPRAGKGDGEGAVLAKIAALPQGGTWKGDHSRNLPFFRSFASEEIRGSAYPADSQ